MKQKQIENMQINTHLLELIAPQGIKLKPNIAEVGENISKFFYVSGYPSSANIGWLSQILNILGATITINIMPIDSQTFIEGIDKGMSADISTYNSTKSEAERTRAELKIQSAKKIIEEIESNSTAYVYISFLAKISGKNDVELEKNCKIFKNKIVGMGLKVRVPSYLTKEAFMQASPFALDERKITDISNKNMPLTTFFGGLPFSGSGFMDTTGFFMGTDESGRMITLDFFKKDKDRTNSNIVIIGTSGGGKSYATKKILLNEYLNGAKIIIIDPESEYADMSKKIDNSKWIDCSGGYGENVGRINPLQVSPLPVDDDDDTKKSELALHFHTLMTFFQLYYPELTSMEIAKLNEVLEELYKNFNIDWETNISKLQNEDFPIMKDLYELLSKKYEENKGDKEIKTLTSVIRNMAIGADSEMFNGYTTIETNSNFIVLDTHSIQGANDRIKRCQYFNILRFCQNIAFRDRNERVFVACDEAYLLVDPKVPQSLEFLRNFSKRARKYECGLIVITQSIIDFLDDSVKQYGQALFDNATYKLFLGMDGRNLQNAQELWNLNKEESNILSSKIKGQGLLFVGSGRLFIRIVGQNFEQKFLTGGGR